MQVPPADSTPTYTYNTLASSDNTATYSYNLEAPAAPSSYSYTVQSGGDSPASLYTYTGIVPNEKPFYTYSGTPQEQQTSATYSAQPVQPFMTVINGWVIQLKIDVPWNIFLQAKFASAPSCLQWAPRRISTYFLWCMATRRYAQEPNTKKEKWYTVPIGTLHPTDRSESCLPVCVCVCACVRACMHACVSSRFATCYACAFVLMSVLCVWVYVSVCFYGNGWVCVSDCVGKWCVQCACLCFFRA